MGVFMLGAIIGDIAGSFREFSKDKFSNLDLFPSKSEIPEYLRARYGITDDSVLTIATWLALQEENVSEDEFRYRYYHYGRCFEQVGYGLGFSKWLRSDYNLALPYNSCGNGSAMRVSPVGWFAKDIDRCYELARMSASVTHNHPEGIKGAAFVALMIYLYRNGETNPEKIIKEKFGIKYQRCAGYDHFDKICQETIPLALFVLDSSSNFHDAVKMAVTFPFADNDTLGAIVGSIAEAKYEGVPVDLAKKALNLIINQAKPEIKRILKTNYSSNFIDLIPDLNESETLESIWN